MLSASLKVVYFYTDKKKILSFKEEKKKRKKSVSFQPQKEKEREI